MGPSLGHAMPPLGPIEGPLALAAALRRHRSAAQGHLLDSAPLLGLQPTRVGRLGGVRAAVDGLTWRAGSERAARTGVSGLRVERLDRRQLVTTLEKLVVQRTHPAPAGATVSTPPMTAAPRTGSAVGAWTPRPVPGAPTPSTESSITGAPAALAGSGRRQTGSIAPPPDSRAGAVAALSTLIGRPGEPRGVAPPPLLAWSLQWQDVRRRATRPPSSSLGQSVATAAAARSRRVAGIPEHRPGRVTRTPDSTAAPRTTLTVAGAQVAEARTAAAVPRAAGLAGPTYPAVATPGEPKADERDLRWPRPAEAPPGPGPVRRAGEPDSAAATPNTGGGRRAEGLPVIVHSAAPRLGATAGGARERSITQIRDELARAVALPAPAPGRPPSPDARSAWPPASVSDPPVDDRRLSLLLDRMRTLLLEERFRHGVLR